MRKLLFQLAGALTVLIAGARGQPVGEVTGVEAAETPMPAFAYSFTGCLAWSCQSGQCSHDPTVWGACCVESSEDPYEQGQPRPSCAGPSYCDQYPSRCGGDSFTDPGLAASYCFHGNVGSIYDYPNTSICSDTTKPVDEPYNFRCLGTGIIGEFPECFPSGGIN